MNEALFNNLNERIWASGARREDLVQRVANALREQIVSGQLAAGTKLVPEAELSKHLGISRPSLREAIRILAHEGLIVVKHGVGTFVSDERKHMVGSLELMRSLTDLIRAAGGEPKSRDLTVELVDADADVAEALDVPEGTPVGRVCRVRLIDDQPFDVAREYIAFDGHAKNFEMLKGFTGGSLYEFVREHLGIKVSHSKLRISAVAADAVMAKELGLPKRAPLLLMREVHYGSDGQPLLFAVNYHNTEVVEFTSMRSGTLV